MVDVSQSMNAKLSGKSDLTRRDAAATLASIIPGDVRVFSFSDRLVEVPPRRGMAGVDAIAKSQDHSGTKMFDSVAALNRGLVYDRLIVISDEQAECGASGYEQSTLRKMPAPTGRGYMINVASAKNGVGYPSTGWTHIDGFSENVLKFIWQIERP
jgi:hypothetical protein